MAQEGNLERRCSDTALKIQAVIRGFVGSLTEILNAENFFEDETNVIGNVLCQTEELKNRLEQLRRLRTDTPSRVASAFERDDKLAGSSRGSSLHSKRARCANPEGEVGICRHFCKDHPQVMDITLWETLPAEVVERICALLPLSKILELLKFCEPWSRLPTATRFRQFCSKAHGDLFGIVMYSKKSRTYRLAIYDSKHEEWSHLEPSTIPPDYINLVSRSELVFGRDGGLMCVIPYDFCTFEEPPRILVFNPLTGDKNYIGVSSFIASLDMKEMNAVLLQLIMDAKPGSYKLILVTERSKPSGDPVYYSESYDSMSGLWSTLDSGFVHDDGVLRGVLGEERCHVCFDCRLKEFCTPAEYKTSVRNPHPHVIHTNVHPDYIIYDPFYSFVRDHRFKLGFVLEIETNEIFSFKAGISESVWQNGWNEKSIVKLAMEMPSEGCEARLLACTRFFLVLAVADDVEDCRQRMALYDRVTCEEVLDIPQFMTEEFQDDEDFMNRSLEFMCDLNWDAIP